MRLATSAERTAFLPEIGIWTTDTGRVIHLGRDHRLWAEPYQSPARVRVTAAIARGTLLTAGLTGHQPGTRGFRITAQPDGRIKAGPALAAAQPAAGPDAGRSRLETLRGQYRQAPGRSGVVQKAGGLACAPAPESRPTPHGAGTTLVSAASSRQSDRRIVHEPGCAALVKPECAAGAARPWPSVKQPTVRTDRPDRAYRPS
jgi:hypothetical protein